MNVMNYFAKCTGNGFFGIEGWYKYLPGTCGNFDFNQYGIGSVWLIIAGITDALLRITAIVAIVFFIFGAFKMVFSQGSAEQVKSARSTMVNAFIGLLIAVLSTWIIGFMLTTVFKVT